MFGRKVPAAESRRNICPMLWRRCITDNPVAAVRQVVTVRGFAVERGDPKNFALIESVGRVAFFEDFNREIFRAVFANRIANN